MLLAVMYGFDGMMYGFDGMMYGIRGTNVRHDISLRDRKERDSPDSLAADSLTIRLRFVPEPLELQIVE